MAEAVPLGCAEELRARKSDASHKKSRSAVLKVAVGFIPRLKAHGNVAERRLKATFDSAVATRRIFVWVFIRGLKATATIIRSLRDSGLVPKDMKFNQDIAGAAAPTLFANIFIFIGFFQTDCSDQAQNPIIGDDGQRLTIGRKLHQAHFV